MRSMTWTLYLALSAVAWIAAAAPASAQNRPKIPPPDFEREWELNEAGERQWKEFDVTCTHCKGAKSHICQHCDGSSTLTICRECDMTKRAPCRVCAGTGKMADPLVELICPICDGSSWIVCGLCNSFGKLTVAEKEVKCGSCKQKGMYECSACDGERRIAVMKVGRKGPGAAKAKDLREALESLNETLAALERYQPDPNPSRSFKEFTKVFEPLGRNLKATKGMQEQLDQVLKGVKSYGAGYANFEDRLIHQFLVWQDRNVYLMQHQIRLMEQCLELAEFNETKKSHEESSL